MNNGKQLLTFTTVLVAVLISAPSIEAQEICYSYDALGRLTGAIDQSNQAAFYDYDAVGNILRIRRENPVGPVNIISVDPTGGIAGARVELFGIGFSATTNQNQVILNGVPLTVVSSTRCHLVVEIPPDATTGQFVVTTPSGKATSSQVFTTFGITIPVTATAVVLKGNLQFTSTITGCSDPRVVWSVNGIIGGNAIYGTISTTGLYTAPAVLPNPANVIIRADSVGCDGLFAEQSLFILEQNLMILTGASVSFGSPVLASLPPNVVNHGASVSFGAPPVGASGRTIFQSASVAEGPAITSMSTTTAARNSNFILTINGSHLSGAFEVEFHPGTGADSQVIATNVVVNPTGTSLTANVSVTGSAAFGPRIVIVKTPVVNSTYANTGANALTIQ